jgi:predicted phage-related endonuclease
MSFEIAFFLEKSSQLLLESFTKVVGGLVRFSLAVYLGDRKEIQEKIERATSDLQDRIESAALDLSNENQSEESAPSAYRWILDTKCTTEA